MVLKKRLDDILIGRQAPAIPRVPKSAKGKRTVRGKAGDDDMSAFNLLAAVAGNLLLERKKSSILRKRTGKSNRSNARYIVKQEEAIEEKPLNEEPFHVGSCIEGASGSEFVRPVFCAQVECLKTQNPMALGPASGIINTDSAYGDACTKKHFFLAEKLYESKVRDGSRMPPIGESEMTGADLDRNALDACKLENPMEADAKPKALVSTENDLDVLMRGDQISFNRSFPKCRDDLELAVDRDDDENSSGCTQPSNQTSRYIKPQVIANPRIRKLLATKFWNAAPTTKMGEFSNTDAKIKHCYQSRRICYSRQKTRRTSFKRKQLFQCCSKSTSKRIISREGRKLSSPIRGQISSYKSRVKLSIKSFKVPELVIEISETSTVGALKRRVMDAVNAVLGGGLRVGVLVQGKKVRDDNKTLRNAGISHMDKLDDLGFTLEPSTVQTISPLSPLTSTPLGCTQEHSNMQNISPCTSIPRGHTLEPNTMQTISPLSRAPLGYTLEPSTMQTISLLSGAEERHSFLACDATRPLTGFPVVASAYDGEKSNVSLELPPVPSINCPESDHESVHSLLSTSSMDKTEIVAREPPAVSVMSNQVLPVDPVNKPGQAELMRRRIRRPFSVPEVEALVQAVEKLGTGRWRDVKLEAFEDAKHRTYVDLKDKWKTLVHTATIAPQQRRGEQVPQELLDRVLSAQAYWSQQQASGPDALCQGLPAPLI